MSTRNGKLLDHLRSTMQTALDPAATPALRAEYARQAAEQAHDLRDALRFLAASTSGSRVLDLVRAQNPREAMSREEAHRHFAAEVRALGFEDPDSPSPYPHNVLQTPMTSQPMPLIRTVARPWDDSLIGAEPIIPGFVTDGVEAEIDPELPAEDGEAMGVVDIASGTESRHLSVLTYSTTRQVRDFLTDDGGRLLDQEIEDLVDLAAETWVAEQLIAEAGGTRAAGADLAAALDDAESAAAGRGPVAYVVVNAVDLPAVRRALAVTHFAGPHPTLYVSAGQPAGTVTYVGREAALLIAGAIITIEAERVRAFETDAATARPFLFRMREADLVQTVTGIGA